MIRNIAWGKFIVAVFDVGRIINEKTAHSRFVGGIVWGLSLALQEDTIVDGRDGRIVNADLAHYHVPVNADVGAIDVSAVDHPDTNFDAQLGARGIREIGITGTGTGAAIANAVYHATGKRVRDLPITPGQIALLRLVRTTEDTRTARTTARTWKFFRV